jgi:Sap, sulfolipid-1-addressing protein
VVFDLVLISIAVALDPIPLTAFLVVLPSRRGVRKGADFVLGWLVSLAVVVAVTVIVTGNRPPKPNTAPSLAALAVRIIVGVGLVAGDCSGWSRGHRLGDQHLRRRSVEPRESVRAHHQCGLQSVRWERCLSADGAHDPRRSLASWECRHDPG